MESGNFEGALYLDETEHDFTISLPSSIGSNDFTLQFRLYQSYTASPQDDSYVRFGSTDLMRFNGSQILNGSSTVLSTMPIGTWNELAIIRQSGTVRYYLNGVQLGTVSNSTALPSSIVFHFGNSQQTYKELDELRVLNYALVEGGVNYTPTSVPHDANLALVLPDSVVPIADEYISIQSTSSNIISQYSMDTPEHISTSSYITVDNWSSLFPYWSYRQSTTYLDYSSGNLYLICNGSNTIFSTIRYKNYDYYGYYPNIGIFVGFRGVSGRTLEPYNTNYGGFVSVVYSDGPIDSIRLSETSWVGRRYITSSVLLDESSDYTLTTYSYNVASTDDSFYMSYIWIYPNTSNPTSGISYIEFSSTPPDISAELVSSVTLMDASSLNTPTLAVRSDIPVTNYQIGGVRPSIPYKGLVWAMVESGYITSLQIYDGRAWVQCDGRIWTGQRWIPYSSYNVVTLSDMYDIADASGNSGYEYIYSESGFWSWFQKAWLDFRQWTSTMLSTVQGLGSGGGSSGGSGSVVNDLEVDPDSEEESSVWLVGFIKRIAKLGGRVVRGVSDIVIEDALWTVSTTTLYRYIDFGFIPNVTNRDLINKRCKKRSYHKVRAARPPKGASIEKRPQIVLDRSTFGHWEMDCVIGKAKGKGEALLVLTERLTRFEIIFKLSAKTALNVNTTVDSTLSKFPQGTFKSITVDNGSEFSAAYQLPIPVYYCHPYTSCERGSNENCNRLVRRFFPKGQSMAHRTQRDADAAAHAINAMHRKILGYRTAQECFEEQLAQLA